MFAGLAEQVDAARERNQFRRPVSGGHERLDPLDHRDPRPFPRLQRALGDGLQPLLQLVNHSRVHSQRIRHAPHVRPDTVERFRIQ